MIVVTGVVEIDAEHVWPATTAAGKMIEATQKEEGCITYCLYVDITDQRKFRIYEEWASVEALAAHMKTPHMAEFQKALSEFRIFDRKIVKYQVNVVQGL